MIYVTQQSSLTAAGVKEAAERERWFASTARWWLEESRHCHHHGNCCHSEKTKVGNVVGRDWLAVGAITDCVVLHCTRKHPPKNDTSSGRLGRRAHLAIGRVDKVAPAVDQVKIVIVVDHGFSLRPGGGFASVRSGQRAEIGVALARQRGSPAVRQGGIRRRGCGGGG